MLHSVRWDNIKVMTWINPPRKDHPELLDMGIGSPADVRRSLDDLWRINIVLGGVWSITRHLYPRIKTAKQPITVLNLGAGSMELDNTIQQWASRQGIDLTLIPLDFARRHLSAAHTPSYTLPRLQANALNLPLAPNSVDYVISSLFLHHFPPQVVVNLLESAWQVARHGVIMSDLVRGRLPELAWHLVRPVFATSYLTYHDGLVSVQRSYLPLELQQMAMQAGLENVSVREQFPWRMTLLAEKSNA